MEQLIYMSAASEHFHEQQIEEILAVARRKNSAAGLTGILLYQDRAFLQVLEGSSETIDNTFHRIRDDDRHAKIVLIGRRQIEERLFPDWSMGLMNPSTLAPGASGEWLTNFLRTGIAQTNVCDPEISRAVFRVLDGFREGRWRQS